MNPPTYWTTGDVAALLVENTDYVLREVKAGRLPCERRIPRRGGRTAYRFTLDEVRSYLETYDRARLPAFHWRVSHGTLGQTTRTG